MGFTIYAYVFKVKSACKSSKVMEMDDNVWNDKDTDDFLRYLKFEYFMCTYFLMKIVSQINYGFNMGFIPGDDILLFGESNFESTKVIFILLLVQSGIAVLNLTLMLRNTDDNLDAEEFRKSDAYSRSKGSHDKLRYVKLAVWLIVFTSIVVLYFQND